MDLDDKRPKLCSLTTQFKIISKSIHFACVVGIIAFQIRLSTDYPRCEGIISLKSMFTLFMIALIFACLILFCIEIASISKVKIFHFIFDDLLGFHCCKRTLKFMDYLFTTSATS